MRLHASSCRLNSFRRQLLFLRSWTGDSKLDGPSAKESAFPAGQPGGQPADYCVRARDDSVNRLFCTLFGQARSDDLANVFQSQLLREGSRERPSLGLDSLLALWSVHAPMTEECMRNFVQQDALPFGGDQPPPVVHHSPKRRLI